MAVQVMTYNIGQGLFNLVCERIGENCRCGVVDCGTLIQTSSMFQEDKLENAAAIIKEEYDGQLSYIVLSHQDNDHWSEILRFLCVLLEADPNNAYRNPEASMAFKFHSGTTSCCTCRKLEDTAEIYKYCEWKKDYEFSVSSRGTGTLAIAEIKLALTASQKSAAIRIHAHKNQSGWAILDFIADITDGEAGFPEKMNGNPLDRAMELMLPHLGRLSQSALKSYLERALQMTSEWFGVGEKIRQTEAVLPVNENLMIYLGGQAPGYSYRALGEILQCFGTVVKLDSSILRFAMENSGFDVIPIGIDNLGMQDDQKMTSPAILRNATSVLTLILHCGHSILLPGDATLHTFGSVLQHTPASIDLMIAPHHGSYHTNVLLEFDGKEAAVQPVKEFFRQKKPKTVFISAFHTCFSHPDLRVVEFMEKSAQPADEHLIGGTVNGKFIPRESTKSIYLTETCEEPFLAYLWPQDRQTKQTPSAKKTMTVPKDCLFL